MFDFTFVMDKLGEVKMSRDEGMNYPGTQSLKTYLSSSLVKSF